MAWLATRSQTGLQAAPVQTPSPTITIAGLLGGNVLVPLGQYANGHWLRTWPTPDDEVERAQTDSPPWAWYPVPGGPPKNWFVWSDEARGVPLRTGKLVLGEAHCLAVWGLATELPSLGHETTAIATDTSSGVQPFRRIALDQPDASSLRRFLRTESKKSAVAALASSQPKGQDGAAVLRQREFEYEVDCVGPDAGERVLCSFVASLSLGKQPLPMDPRSCDDILLVQGWLTSEAGRFHMLQNATMRTDCDAMEVRTVAPYVLIEFGSRQFAVTKEHGYEDESFAVFELHPDRLDRVLDVPGGGC